MTSACLWFDEVFSVHAARYGWAHMLDFVAADAVHPPLFYMLLKVWVALGGESLLWLRLLPCLIGIVAAAPFLLLCRELGLCGAQMRLALLLMAVNGYLIKYAQEVRMYSLLLLLSLCSLWLFLRFLSSRDGAKRELLGLTVVNLLMVYTHYYGWMLVAAEAIYLLLRGRAGRLRFLISVAALVLCFSPWVYLVLTAERGEGLAQNIGWVARPRAEDVAQLFTLLNEPFYYRQSSNERLYSGRTLIACLALFGLPLLALVRRMWREEKQTGARGENSQLRWLLYFSFAAPVLVFALSWVLPQSVWGTRHLIIVAGPYMMLAAMALNRLRPIAVKLAVLVLLGCWLFFAATLALLSPAERHIWCAWEGLSRQLVEAQPAPTEVIKVYAFEDLVAYHLWFAVGSSAPERYRVSVVKGVTGLREDAAYFLPRAFHDISVEDSSALLDSHIWIAFRDADWDESRPPLKTVQERGYRVGNVLKAEVGGQRAFLVELWRKP